MKDRRLLIIFINLLTSKENRTQGMGMIMAALSLGFIIGPALEGITFLVIFMMP